MDHDRIEQGDPGSGDPQQSATPGAHFVQIDWEAILVNGTLHMFGYSRDVSSHAVSH